MLNSVDSQEIIWVTGLLQKNNPKSFTMPNTKLSFVLICNYGILDETIRRETEWQGLIEYYQQINQYLDKNDNKNKNTALVLCGGYTNPLKPNISEAESAKNYLKQHIFPPSLKHSNILTENTSQNSLENLVFGMLTLRSLIKQEETNSISKLNIEIIIFCDIPRTPKIQFIVDEILKPALNGAHYQFNFQVIALKREDTHFKSNQLEQNKEIEKLKNSSLIKIYKDLLKICYAL